MSVFLSSDFNRFPQGYDTLDGSTVIRIPLSVCPLSTLIEKAGASLLSGKLSRIPCDSSFLSNLHRYLRYRNCFFFKKVNIHPGVSGKSVSLKMRPNSNPRKLNSSWCTRREDVAQFMALLAFIRRTQPKRKVVKWSWNCQIAGRRLLDVMIQFFMTLFLQVFHVF